MEVGTKLKLGPISLQRHDTVGVDLVGALKPCALTMLSLTSGAEPLFFLGLRRLRGPAQSLRPWP